MTKNSKLGACKLNLLNVDGTTAVFKRASKLLARIGASLSSSVFQHEYFIYLLLCN